MNGLLLIYDFVEVIARYKEIEAEMNCRPFYRRHFKCIMLNEISFIIQIPLNIFPKGSIDNNSAFVEIMAWHRTSDRPLSEPNMA